MFSGVMIGRRFHVREALGRGAFGEVFLAEDLLHPGRLVALKTRRLDPFGAGKDPTHIAREFRLLTRLRHPNLARVYDLGLTRDPATRAAQVYFTREYVEGVDLVTAFDNAPAARLSRAAALLCHAIATMHDHGVIHGDLSPANVLNPPGTPEEIRVIDFGLAEIVGPGDSSQVSGLTGSMPYVAPELLRGAHLSQRTDLYGLGALLFHVIAGRPPFQGTPAEIIQSHLSTVPPSLDELRDDLPAELVAVVRRLLAKDPSHRYASAWDALRDLEEVAAVTTRPWVEAPLVGREAELTKMERLVRPGAEARVVALIGDDGAGRTRFLEALRWRLEMTGRVEVVELHLSESSPDPLTPVRELVAKLSLVGGRDPPESLFSQLEGEPRWHAIATFAVEALEAGHSALLVDDLHRASEPAVEVLCALARGLEEATQLPPLVVASAPCASLDRLLTEVDGTERVELGELAEAEVEGMVAALAGAPRPELARRIRAHASGLPGHVEEVTRALLDRDGEPSLEALPLPLGLESAIGERLDRLPKLGRRLLEAIATSGGDASWPELQAILPELGNDTFDELVRDLCARGFLIEGDQGRFAFLRSSVRDAVYLSCPSRIRRRIHHDLASRLTSPEGPMPIGEALLAAALHAVRARPRGTEAARAVELALAAARTLNREGAAASAASLLANATPLAKGESLRLVRLALAEALATRGEYDEAVRLLDLAAGEASGPERAEALVQAGGVLERRGSYDEASSRLSQALACELPPRTRAAGLEALARVQLARGAFSEAGRAAEEALEAAPRGRVAARALATAGIAASYRGDHAQALLLLNRAKDQADASADRSTRALVAGHQAIAFDRAGERQASASAYREAAQLAEEGGDLGRLPAHLVNLGVAHHGLGEYGQALDLYRRAAGLARRMGKRSVVVAALVNLADLFAFLGEAEEGRKTALRALMLARSYGMTAFAARALQALAECAACQSPAAGVEDAKQAAQLFDQLGMGSHAVEARLVSAELMLWAGEPRRAEEQARQVETNALGLDESSLIARSQLLVEEAVLAQGVMSTRLELLERLARSPDERSSEQCWRALAALGAHFRLTGDEARAERSMKEAAELLRRLAGQVPPEHREALNRHPGRRAVLDRALPAPRAGVAEERVFRLMEVNRAVLSEHDPRRLLALALDTAIELCGAERGFLITLGPRGAVRVEVARNLDREAVRSARLKVSRSIAEEVARTGQPLLTIDALEDERFAHLTSVRDLRLRSVMCVPIRGRQETLGTLYLDNRFESARFDESDLKLLLAFADVVALALENARLIQENANKAAELEEAKQQLEAVSHRQARQLESALRELEATREALGLKYDYSKIIGQSAKMLRVFKILDRIIDTHVSLLIHGESGTGKELIAHAVHYNGLRKQAPFISVNCGAIPEPLLESELFGHIKGAFTGATANRQGLLQAAHGGTLFLDEIGDMSLAMQTKLLRALQEGEVRPVGSIESLRVDVRVVAASHRDLKHEVAEGRFREDLFYRVNVVQIELPPLRERRDDIPILAEHLLEKCAGELGGVRKHLTAPAIARLLEHDWPGNVRELENVLKNAAVLSAGATIEAIDIPLPQGLSAPVKSCDTLDLAQLEHDTIERALQASGGNKKKAAELLGIARLTLYRKLKGFGST